MVQTESRPSVGGKPIPWRLVAGVPPVLFLSVFFLLPVAGIVVRGLRPRGQWNLAIFSDVLSDSTFQRVLWFSVWQAVVSTVLCVAVALPGAALFARYSFRGKRLLWSALLIPFVLPTVVVGVAMLGMIGGGGILSVDLSGTVWAILIAHVFFNYAVVVRTVGSTWSTIDPHLEESARTLGASPFHVFRTVTWPLIRSSVTAAASIVFLFCFTSFGIVLILGGVEHRTLEVEIYDQTAKFLHLDVAAVLALVQLVLVVTVLLWFGRSERRRSVMYGQRAATETERVPTSMGQRMFVAGNLLFITIFLGAPILELVVRSFSTPDGVGLGFFESLNESRAGSTAFVPPLEAVWNSLLYATLASLIAVGFGLCAAWAIAGRGGTVGIGGVGRWTDVLLMIPLGTSAVTVGFGFLIVFDTPPFDLRSSILLIPIAHAIVALPFVVRLLVPAMRSIDPALREAASTLGASPAKVWRSIDLPILARGLAAATGFAFAVSLGEFGATAFLVRPDHPTVPTAIYRALGRPGENNFGQAMALSTILIVMTVLVMMLIDRFRPSRVAEF